ncbi:MAG: 30S ribosomal protein S16 [Planctomycetes bacterium]|jgi:small subunit ribosomal protein S16|nr:30S ribosomal protein S16 [Planctomycetota bacterium]
MVVMIRLKRTGRRNRACFRLNAIEGRNPRDGRVLENLGLYDPLAPRVEDQLRLRSERILDWVGRGARLSETAVALCRRQGIEVPAPSERKKRARKRSATKTAAKEARFRTILKAKKERAGARAAAKLAAAKAEASKEE